MAICQNGVAIFAKSSLKVIQWHKHVIVPTLNLTSGPTTLVETEITSDISHRRKIPAKRLRGTSYVNFRPMTGAPR